MSKTMDMTTGKPLNKIIRFSIPLLLGSTINMIYSLIDSIVAGRLIGIKAYAAIGASSFAYWLILSIINGMRMGFLSVFSQKFGAKTKSGLNKSVAMSFFIALIVGLPISVLSTVLTAPILSILNTPLDIFASAQGYLQIRFASLIFIFIANILSSVFFAVGNSRIPFLGSLLFVITSVSISITLVKGTTLGISAMAISASAAQTVQILFYIYFLKRYKLICITKKDFAFDIISIKELLTVTIPFAFRDLPSAITSLAIQYVVNGYGSLYIAGIASAKSLYSILFAPGDSISEAMASFVGQNFGAKNLKRITTGMKQGVIVLFISVAILIPIVFFAGRFIISLFISGNDGDIQQILDIAMQQLLIILFFLPTYYLLAFYRAVLRGVGNGFHSLLSGIVETSSRLIGLLVLPPLLGIWGVYLVEVIGWPLMSIQLIISFGIIFKRVKKDFSEN